MTTIVLLWLCSLFGCLFVLGTVVGSFLNVVIYRLPLGKNLFWPSSRCGRCLTAIALWDNIPLLSYWILRGRCRFCTAPFSLRYFAVELTTGLLFVLLYLVEIAFNVHAVPAWRDGGLWYLEAGQFPPGSWEFFTGHAILTMFVLVSGFHVFERGSLPRALPITAAVLGLGWSALLNPFSGILPWRVDSVPASHEWGTSPHPVLGFTIGLAGLLVGPTLLRLVNALHRVTSGREAFGPTPPAVLLLTGAFLGWQITIIALAVATGVTLAWRTIRRDLPRRFSLLLLGCLVVCWLAWRIVGAIVQPWFVEPFWVGLFLFMLTGGLCGIGLAPEVIPRSVVVSQKVD
jgi:leader peptidase (prepilin peptidase)/N-methyltransferase